MLPAETVFDALMDRAANEVTMKSVFGSLGEQRALLHENFAVMGSARFFWKSPSTGRLDLTCTSSMMPKIFGVALMKKICMVIAVHSLPGMLANLRAAMGWMWCMICGKIKRLLQWSISRCQMIRRISMVFSVRREMRGRQKVSCADKVSSLRLASLVHGGAYEAERETVAHWKRPD